jgi:hypothetical protein
VVAGLERAGDSRGDVFAVASNDCPLLGQAGSAGCGDGFVGVFTQREQEVDSELGGEFTGGAVRFAGRGSEFAHVADDGEAPAAFGKLRQKLQRGPHRLRIRVVGVIDQCRATREQHGDQPSGDGTMARQAGRYLVERRARCQSSRRRRQGVAPGGFAEAGHLDRDPARIRDEFELPAAVAAGSRVQGAYVGVRTGSEAQHPCRSPRGLRGNGRIVCVQHRDGILAKCGDQIAFFACDLLAAPQVLDVRGANVCEQAHRWLGDVGEPCDFAAVVHSELHHHAFVRLLASQQGQWEAELVVEVPLVLQAGRRHRQNCSAHLLRGRLPVASGNGHHRPREAGSMPLGEFAQGDGGVVHTNHGQVVRNRRGKVAPVFDQQSGGPRSTGGGEEGVGVVGGPDDRDEEVARRHRAAVDGYSGEARVGIAALDASAGPICRGACVERNAHCTDLRASAFAASLQSSKGNFERPMIW